MRKNLFALAFIFTVTGCSWAPGMKMEDPPPNVPHVTIRAITTEVIQEQKDLIREIEKPVSNAVPDAGDYRYLIGPRDVLSITVWGHPDLTLPEGAFRSAEIAGHLVAEDGTIFFPYAGKVKVAGKTVVQVREELTKKIASAIVDPQLDVKVVAFRSQKAYAVGEVGEPGARPITDVPLRVLDIVNQAGGLTPEADVHSAILKKGEKSYPIDLWALYQRGDVTQNRLLEDGDVIHIPDRSQRKVFVMGEVANPSSIFMSKPGMTLTEAIGDAGGVDRVTSNPEFIYVLRGGSTRAEIYWLDSSSPDALILGDQFPLKPRDVVYVETAGVTRWNRVIEQILPTARTIGFANAVAVP